jgi:alkyl hydroperoxide reductase subunit D
MSLTFEELSQAIPAYAKDLKLNLSSVLRQTELTPQQTWGTAVASALASGNKDVYAAISGEGAKNLSPEALEGAKAAGAIMGMNNIYYRFQHLAEKEKYATIPARLRMNVMRQHGTDPVDFELWSLAASAINGCGKCISAHERVLVEKGVNEESIAAAIRIASVIAAIAGVFDVEPAAAVGAAA